MAYITPQDVLEYSTNSVVKNRGQVQLISDIIQAEAEVFSYVGHRFDIEPYFNPETGVITLPEQVKLAIIKLAEYYAVNNSDENMLRGYQSERISDYQYTLRKASEVVSAINLDALLGPYKLVETTNSKKGLRFRLGAF